MPHFGIINAYPGLFDLEVLILGCISLQTWERPGKKCLKVCPKSLGKLVYQFQEPILKEFSPSSRRVKESLAYIDPMIVQSYLQFAGASRPLVWEGTFRTWFLRPLMRVVRAVKVPDLQKKNRQAYRETVQLIREARILCTKHNVLLSTPE